MRYLVDSEYGWLGGFGFAAPALWLADRDRWIGWDIQQKRDYLHTIVNMSRFLIRPSVHCANLASRLLSMAMRRLPEDFDRHYNYRSTGLSRVLLTQPISRARATRQPIG
jgi:Druantia protein DruA